MTLRWRRFPERRPWSPPRSAPEDVRAAVADPRVVAARTAEVVAARRGWVWPWWLERQVDPASHAWMPAGPLGLLPNATGRSWTRIGALDGSATALVDPRGLVCAANSTWSLDWWIGADDRWHLPSREAAVRQRLVDNAPVVETVMRVPGGDARHRAFVVRLPTADGGDHALVVEIENDSAVPFAVGIALRPATVEGVGHVDSVAVEGSVISVDGRPALQLDRQVALAAAGDRAIDSAAIAFHGDAIPPPVTANCPDGLAQAVAIVPLAHRATMRLVLPVDVHDAPLQGFPSVLPQATNVAAGWTAVVDRGARLVPPPGRLIDAIAIAHRQLLVFGAVEAAGGAPYTEPLDRLLIATTLDEFGHHDQAGRVIARWLASLVQGGLIRTGVKPAQVAAALVALARHTDLAADALGAASADVVGMAASWLANVASDSTADVGALVWTAAGLRAAARVLTHNAKEDRAASDADVVAGAVSCRRNEALQRWADGEAEQPFHDLPRRLLAFGAFGVVDPFHPAVAAARTRADDVAASGEEDNGLVSFGPGLGLDPAATIDLIALDVARASRGVTDTREIAIDVAARLTALLDVASPTGAWPMLLHPQLKAGCAGDGHHAGTTARLLRLAGSLFVAVIGAEPGAAYGDPTTPQIGLCPVLLDDWYGQSLEAHRVATPAGNLSFAVRWHSVRPAILWELQPHGREESPGSAPITLRSPGLDPTWSSTVSRGEALLNPAEPTPHEAPESGA